MEDKNQLESSTFGSLGLREGLQNPIEHEKKHLSREISPEAYSSHHLPLSFDRTGEEEKQVDKVRIEH